MCQGKKMYLTFLRELVSAQGKNHQHIRKNIKMALLVRPQTLFIAPAISIRILDVFSIIYLHTFHYILTCKVTLHEDTVLFCLLLCP